MFQVVLDLVTLEVSVVGKRTYESLQGTYNGIDYYVYPRIPGNEERQPVVHSIRGRARAMDRLGLGLGLGLGSGLPLL